MDRPAAALKESEEDDKRVVEEGKEDLQMKGSGKRSSKGSVHSGWILH